MSAPVMPAWPECKAENCDDMEAFYDYAHKRAAAWEARARLAVEALNEAIEDIESWGAYASEYFQEKHDLAGALAKHKTTLAAIGPLPELPPADGEG